MPCCVGREVVHVVRARAQRVIQRAQKPALYGCDRKCVMGHHASFAPQSHSTTVLRSASPSRITINLGGGLPPCAAVLGEHEDTVALLLDFGADPNARGGAPLRFARKHGFDKIEAMLVARLKRPR